MAHPLHPAPAMPPAITRDEPMVVALVALCLAVVACVLSLHTGMAAADAPDPSIDPDLHELVRGGRARVLVELRVAPATSAHERPAMIATAQRALLERLSALDVVVARRYTTIPYIALEIDAAALRALQRMGDLVVRVIADRPARPGQ